MQLSYRRDIDGLRAVAVVLVVWFHAFPNALKGGFIGVDIFFVISGFLISGIIFADLDAGRFSFATFYHRRVRRILPALLGVVGATLAVGWLIMTPDELTDLGRHAASAALFIANISFWKQSGYFDTPGMFKPLLHLWSLGVEEQFYFLLPPVLWLFYRRPRFVAIVIALALVSFAFNIIYLFGFNDAAAAFYLPQSRVWEFLAGTLLALHARRYADTRPPYCDAASLAGVVMIAGAAYLLRDRGFPGVAALLPVGGAALIIASGPTAWANRVLLSRQPVVFIGLISYSLYLWHWPVLVFPRIVNMGPLTVAETLCALAIGAILAVLSWRYIEQPFRRRPANAATSPLKQPFRSFTCIGIKAWPHISVDQIAYVRQCFSSVQ